ncbi:hypothetical protein BpHYR1_016123 [Brachionus plicatilis]|uniref:Uncharacterized protein n=1 Tax=Brachionus plicatilis TaxID=10195 RepID=A0A3M7QQ76_BRAPC|nr:hypothetical protein BpHYR1_016123 [Brachionus plicatilis]
MRKIILDWIKIGSECDQKNSSKFFNSKLKQFLDKRIGESTSGLIESFKPEISKIDFGSISKSIEKFESHILQITEKINNSGTNDIFNQNIFDGLLIKQEVSEAFKSDIEDLKEFRQLINDSETKEAFENLLDQVKKIKKELKNVSIQKNFGDSLENTLSSFTLPEVETLKETKIQELLDAVPSCQILSNLYQSLTLSVCYEFIDNFNTFWTTLYALIILFFVICCFAFVQADLLRKYYRYDELLEEDIGDEKSSAQFDLQRQRSSRANSGAIDAYEMKGYNHAGMKYPSNRSPPSTRNTRA